MRVHPAPVVRSQLPPRSLASMRGRSVSKDRLSKPVTPFNSRQPLVWINVDELAAKQLVSFESDGSPSYSVFAAGQLPFGVIAAEPLQAWKWAISSEKAMLYECAAHGT